MTQAIEKATLSDRQLRTRLEIAQGKGFSLENATKDQLNMVYLVAQRYQLDPLTHVGLFQGRPWYTIDGRIYLARRHPQFKGLSTRPLTAEEKDAWDYKPDDLVVECTMHTKDWGDIKARGKVTAAERGKNTPTGSHPQEMAEKRAIARASRLAFGLEIPDATDVEDAQAERDDPQKLAHDAQRYTEIFGEDGDVYDVDTTTGEVLEAPQAQAIVDQAHDAAARRQAEIAAIDLQRHREGII
jgi:RecT family